MCFICFCKIRYGRNISDSCKAHYGYNTFSLGAYASFINKNVFLICRYWTYNGNLQILRSRFIYRQNRFRNACLYGNCILYNECIFFFRKRKKHTIHSFMLPCFRSLRNCRQCSHNLFYVVLDLIGKIILY